MFPRLRPLIIACLVLNAIIFFWTAARTLPFPYGMDYGEGILLDQAVRIAANEELYRTTWDCPPYVNANYPPLYPLLIAGIGAATGWPSLLIGRSLSLVASLVGGWAIWMLARRWSGSKLAGWLATILFLGNPLVAIWGLLARVDALALGLNLLALWLLVAHWRSWPGLIAAVLCTTAAIFTRQTSILTVPLAALVWLWPQDRRRCVAFLASLALLCLMLFAALDFATHGGFLSNAVIANVMPYSLNRALDMLAKLVLVWPFALLAALLVLTQRRKRTTPPASWLTLSMAAYGAGALIHALMVGKHGSNVNYFLDLMAATALWVVGGVARGPERMTWRPAAVMLVTLCQVVWSLVGSVILYQTTVAARWTALPQYDALFTEVKAATAQGPVLADDYVDLVVLAGQRVYFQPFEYQQLYRTGRWDPADLVDEIAGHRFPLILMNPAGPAMVDERWSRPVMDAIQASYCVTERWRDVVLYRPDDTGQSARCIR